MNHLSPTTYTARAKHTEIDKFRQPRAQNIVQVNGFLFGFLLSLFVVGFRFSVYCLSFGICTLYGFGNG